MIHFAFKVKDRSLSRSEVNKSQLNLVHNGQQITKSQSESPERITVFKLQSQTMLQLRDQDALAIRATSLMPVQRKYNYQIFKQNSLQNAFLNFSEHF